MIAAVAEPRQFNVTPVNVSHSDMLSPTVNVTAKHGLVYMHEPPTFIYSVDVVKVS